MMDTVKALILYSEGPHPIQGSLILYHLILLKKQTYKLWLVPTTGPTVPSVGIFKQPGTPCTAGLPAPGEDLVPAGVCVHGSLPRCSSSLQPSVQTA